MYKPEYILTITDEEDSNRDIDFVSVIGNLLSVNVKLKLSIKGD